MQDTLLWIHNTKNGEVTVSLAYDLIVSSQVHVSNYKTQARLWNFGIPLKLKCFLWLVLEKHISTWDNILRNGWVGPNRCCLYLNNKEYIDHIFIFCAFVKNIIDLLFRKFGQGISWSLPFILENIKDWYQHSGVSSHLPLFLIWNIWISHNISIF